MFQDVEKQIQEKMDSAVSALKGNLSKLRTGRASLVMLDGVRVDYYGTSTPLNQVATMAIPEPRLITIQPWETNIIAEIEKSIERANLGLNPTNDGKIIRLPIPQLTEERRREIVKQLKGFGEDCRIAIRQARKDANDMIKTMEKNKELSEDDSKRAQDQIQKMTDGFVKQVDQIVATKETDIMTV